MWLRVFLHTCLVYATFSIRRFHTVLIEATRKKPPKTHLSSDSTFCISVYRNDLQKSEPLEKEGAWSFFAHSVTVDSRRFHVCLSSFARLASWHASCIPDAYLVHRSEGGKVENLDISIYISTFLTIMYTMYTMYTFLEKVCMMK